MEIIRDVFVGIEDLSGQIWIVINNTKSKLNVILYWKKMIQDNCDEPYQK